MKTYSETTNSNCQMRASESVWRGHPDKVADNISDAVLDACLEQDKFSRVACEVYLKSNLAVIGGEITTRARIDFTGLVRRVIRDIGYVNDDDVFHADRVFVMNAITSQSEDIAQGVDERAADGKEAAEQGAGDQGMMFGFACDETPELMPASLMFAHRLGRHSENIRMHGGPRWLRPDGKGQVCVRYKDGRPEHIANVVISNQHTPDASPAEIRAFFIDEVIKKVLPAGLIDAHTKFYVNPTGRFVVGGPQGDTGLTGRKIIVDTYGGVGRHGGGAFSGKDATKVDRSAAYYARYAAKNIVAAGLARRCEVQFAYAIGHAEPLCLSVETFGTAIAGLSDAMLLEAMKQVFRFKPADIISQLDLRRPIYAKTTNYGHFGKIGDPDITWELTNRVGDLHAALGRLQPRAFPQWAAPAATGSSAARGAVEDPTAGSLAGV